MTRMMVKYIWTLGLLLSMYGMASAEEANLQWARATTLSSLVNGVVTELHVKPGQRVKKGQILLRMQQDVFISRLRAAESLVKRNYDLFTEAKAEFQRVKEMYDNSMLSEHELELKRLAVLMAETEYKQALALQATARFQQQQSIVLAPFDAIITDVFIAQHEAVNSELKTAPLIALVSSRSMSVRVKLELKEAMKLKPDATLKVKLAGKSYDATISKIQLGQGPGGYSSAAVAEAVIELLVSVSPNSKNYPGQTVSIQLP